MNYDVIYFSKHNISTASATAKTAVADWLLFIQEGATVADASVTYLESYVNAADKNIAAFELRQTPADTGRHTDPVTLEIDFVDTAAVLVKRSAFEEVGGFDTNFNLLAFVDLSWRLRAAGYSLQACPMATVTMTEPADERYEYIYGQYERLLLGYKWGRDSQAKAEFEQTLKAPRHFDGVRKELAKLYAQHFLKVPALKKFRKTKLFNPLVCDFSQSYGPWRGKAETSDIQTQPLVSIVIRTHKRKEVLRRTLMCLRNQIYKNFEIVIVEDGENTAEEMVKANFADLNINYFSTGVNVGRGRAGNIGIERAKGEFVSFLDDDDFYYPDFISGHVCKFIEHPQADVVISGIMAVKSDTISIDPFQFEYKGMYSVLFDHITLMDMCVKCRIPMTGAMFRREMYEKYGGMREDIDADEDWFMWLKYITHGNRINPYSADINRAMSMFLYPANETVAKEREERYRVYDKIMLYDESLVFDVHGSEIREWEEFVSADINHLRNIGALPQFLADLKPLGVEKLEYNPDGTNRISAKQINNYYYWMVEEFSK